MALKNHVLKSQGFKGETSIFRSTVYMVSFHMEDPSTRILFNYRFDL